MQKIISVFQRNYDGDRLVRDEVVPGAEWVLAGEGMATRKWDGVCCMIEAGVFYRRFELKSGKVAPVGFKDAQEPDTVTGDTPGWIPVGDGPEDQWFREAMRMNRKCFVNEPYDGTYEAVGPHFQGNAESFPWDGLIEHGKHELAGFPRDFAGMKQRLSEGDIEGVVFWHPDGRKAKIKAKDFGIRRKKP